MDILLSLQDIQRTIDLCNAKKITLQERQLRLKNLVGKAKRREELQPKIQEVLEKMQEDLHAKTVGLYEDLMTALVKDVLTDEKSIKLTLETDRGMPSLEIESVKKDGKTESIMDGSGGSLTNITSAALRFITSVRSESYPFMVLDEPDCWLKPDKIPVFSQVIAEVARDLQMQILMISHHEQSLFTGGVNVIEFKKENNRVVLDAPKNHEWTSDRKGIQWIKLTNFMSHENTTISLSPNVNCIIGENDIGKSAVVSALRSLFYGESSDAFIRHEYKSFSVELGLNEGGRIRFEHFENKSPKRVWQYFVSQQKTPVMESSPKGGVPDWLIDLVKIERVEGLDVAFTSQKTPVFLLNESKSKRASVLAVGHESHFVQKMIAKNKQKRRDDLSLIKEGEREGESIINSLKILDQTDQCTENWIRLNLEVKKNLQKREQFNGLALKISKIKNLQKKAQLQSWSPDEIASINEASLNINKMRLQKIKVLKQKLAKKEALKWINSLNVIEVYVKKQKLEAALETCKKLKQKFKKLKILGFVKKLSFIENAEQSNKRNSLQSILWLKKKNEKLEKLKFVNRLRQIEGIKNKVNELESKKIKVQNIKKLMEVMNEKNATKTQLNVESKNKLKDLEEWIKNNPVCPTCSNTISFEKLKEKCNHDQN